MNWILFDNSRKKYSFIAHLWGDTSIKEIYSPDCSKKIISWLSGVYSALKYSHKGDTIICWFDFQAVLAYWLGGAFPFYRRKIVCINVMLKDKNTLRNRVVGWLYKRALSSERFFASVTSVEYGEWLNHRFGTQHHFQLIRDVFHENYTLKETVSEKPNTVFCGGSNGRDWNFMLQVAKLLPNVNFRFVMPQHLYEAIQTEIPQNVMVRCNIPYIEFMREMCGASIVALPLDTIAPAGLIVLFQAAANHRLVMMTDTVTTRGYITPKRGLLLPNEAQQWVESISHMLAHSEERASRANALRTFLAKECSEENFVNGIKQII